MARYDAGLASFERLSALVIVGLLFLAAYYVVHPFLAAILWAVIIAVSVWPLHAALSARLGGRGKLSALIITVVLAVTVMGPVGWTLESLRGDVVSVSEQLRALEASGVPPPPDWIGDIPFVGDQLREIWAKASQNLPAALTEARPFLERAAQWLITQGASAAFTVLEFVFAIIIAGLLLNGGERSAAVVRRVAVQLGGERGVASLDIARRAVYSVSLGVIGTALLTAALAAVAFIAAGLPAAALLGFLVFFMAVIQIGPAPVWVPVAGWLFYTGDTGWAIFVTAWSAIVLHAVDGLLKPYLISRGSGMPLSLIFIGVLGGMLAWGMIGIFLGATLLAVLYNLFRTWIGLLPDAASATAPGASAAANGRPDGPPGGGNLL